MMKLVAIGNRCMKDDGVAVRAAELLEDELAPMGVQVIIGETDCQSCFYSLDKDDFVFLLDAVFTGKKPGSLHLFSLEEAVSQSFNPFAQHDMGLIELMKLYGSNFNGCLIGLEISEIGFGTDLSPVLKDKLPKLCEEIKDTIKKIIGEQKRRQC